MPAKKIVLSDDPALLEIFKNSYFQQENFTMVLVKDGQTGFQAVEAEAPSLAIFDIAVLGEQAIECCRSIKHDALLANTPVLLVIPENAVEKMMAALDRAKEEGGRLLVGGNPRPDLGPSFVEPGDEPILDPKLALRRSVLTSLGSNPVSRLILPPSVMTSPVG